MIGRDRLTNLSDYFVTKWVFSEDNGIYSVIHTSFIKQETLVDTRECLVIDLPSCTFLFQR